MPTPLESLIAAGTKLWLDSVDPEEVVQSRKYGATGATSNPLIIAGLIQTGRFDGQIRELLNSDDDDAAIAWRLTDQLVRNAQQLFDDVYTNTQGNDGYVSFELDPLLEDADCPLTVKERAERYVSLGKQWSAGHRNRMIKVPATAAGLAALEELTAAGITLNVTLIFTARQYRAARDAVWRGAQRRESCEQFKSVYSIFVSRVDVYTQQQLPELSPAAQGLVGIVNAQRICHENKEFWSDKQLPLEQEIVFASTGTKNPDDPPDKYLSAFVGSDIQTNPPAMNRQINASTGTIYSSTIDQLPAPSILNEIDTVVNWERLEAQLMQEGLAKFANPQKELIALIAKKRKEL